MSSAVGSIGSGLTTNPGSLLSQILQADDIQPGDDISYQLCKAIFIAHPLGSKMAEGPIRLAQSKERKITVPDSPEEEVVEAFQLAWEEMDFSRVILNVCSQGRVYGISSVGILDDTDPATPLDLEKLWERDVTFNLFDPLNTAGSMVTSQDPNSPLFQKWGDLNVVGQRYHRTRTTSHMNEESLYIAWTSSAYGYVGRSVYQRALYPLKSFLQSMITDDMVTRKAGLIIARMEQAGSIVDRVMQTMFGVKRNLLKEGQTNNVLSVGINEVIETLNMRNVNDSMTASRENIIKNIATAADMPAKMLTAESFVLGFGEGTQDAYAIAQYGDRTRIEIRPRYRWADRICQYRAWTPEFYKNIQRKFPEQYGEVTYKAAFYRWQKSFRATWLPLVEEKPSEAVEVERIKFEAVTALVQVLVPLFDPENKAQLISWTVEQVNANEQLFGAAKILLNERDLADYFAEQAERAEAGEGPGGEVAEEQREEGTGTPPKPFSAHDAARSLRILEGRMRAGESAREAVRG